MRRLTLSTSGKSAQRQSLTARERHQDIIDRLDTLTQAIKAARARTGQVELQNALTAALASTIAAQRHMEEIT